MGDSNAFLNPMLAQDHYIQANSGSPKDLEHGNESDSQRYDILSRYLDDADSRLTWRLTLVLALGTAIDAVEVLCLGFILGDLSDVSLFKKEFLSSAVFVGMLLGGIGGGILSDKYGRKLVLISCLILNAFAAIASPFSPDIDWLIGFRVFGGIGVGGSLPILFSLASELLPCLTRGKMLSVIASFWMVGSLYTAIIGWVVLGDDAQHNRIYTGEYNNWRGFAFMCAIPILITVSLMIRYVPESPRYLWQRNRLAEIPKVLEIVTGKAPTVEELLESKNREIGMSSFFQREVMKGNVFASFQDQPSGKLPESHGTSRAIKDAQLAKSINSFNLSNTQNLESLKPEENHGFLDNVRELLSPGTRWIFLILCFIWFLLCFGTYGLATWITVLFEKSGLSNPYLDTLIYTLANLPGNLATFWYLDVVGRRFMLSVGMVLSAISVVLISCDLNNVYCIVICAALFNFFSTAGWNALDVLTAESFATKMRSTAMGTCTAFGRLGAIAAQFVFGSLIGDIPVLLTVTSVLLVAGGLLSLALPKDTTGLKLST